MIALYTTPSVLFKIDLAKVFDSVNCVYLIELLTVVSFPLRWNDWISTMLSIASTKIL